MDFQPQPSAGANARRVALALTSAAVAIAFFKRDRLRRSAGLTRRAPLEVIADMLSSLNIAPSRWLALFVVNHRTTASLLTVLVAFLLFKYQQYLRRVWRRMTRNYDVSPTDALTEYPSSEDAEPVVLEPETDRAATSASATPTAAGHVGTASAAPPPLADAAAKPARSAHVAHLRQQGSLSDGMASSGDDGEDSDDLTEDEATVRHMVSVIADSIRRAARPGRAVSAPMEGGVPSLPLGEDSLPAYADILRFLRMMRHTIGGIDTRAVLSLYPQMERLRVPAGTVLFHEGADAADGMYIILKGTVGVYALEHRRRAASHDSVAHENGSADDGFVAGLSFASLGSEPDVGIAAARRSRGRRHSQPYTAGSLGQLLCTFSQAQTVGENALLATTALTSCARAALQAAALEAPADEGHTASAVTLDGTRPVTCATLTESVVLRLNRDLFSWFTDTYPNAIVSFILTTTTRQWRVAYYLLVDFLHLRDAWVASLEPPFSAPAFVWEESRTARHGSSEPSGPGSVVATPQAAADSPRQPGNGVSTSAGNGRAARLTPSALLTTPPRPRGALAAVGGTAATATPNAVPPRLGVFQVLSTVTEAAQGSSGGGEASSASGDDGERASRRSTASSAAALGLAAGETADSGVRASSARDAPAAHASSAMHGVLPFAPPVPLSLAAMRASCSAVLLKQPGESVYAEGADADSLYIVISGYGACTISSRPAATGPVLYSAHVRGHIDGEHVSDGLGSELRDAAAALPGIPTRIVGPGCIAGGQACLVGLPHKDSLTALSVMEVAVFSRRLFSSLADGNALSASAVRITCLLEISLAVSRSLAPLLRMFLSFGLQRLWLKSGEVLFEEGDDTNDGLYVVISGRLRTYTGGRKRGRTVAETAGVLETGQLPDEVTRPSAADEAAVGSDDEPASPAAPKPLAKAHRAGREVRHGAHEDAASTADSVTDDDAASTTTAGSTDGAEGVPLRRSRSAGDDSALRGDHRMMHAATFSDGDTLGADRDAPGTRKPARQGGSLRMGGSRIESLSQLEGKDAKSLRIYSARSTERGDAGRFTPATRGGIRPRAQPDAVAASGGIRVDIGRGETVGELSVIVRQKRRNLTAVCSRDCELVRITRASFELISNRYPSVMTQFTRVLAKRYQELTARIAGAGGSAAPVMQPHNQVALPRASSMLRSHVMRAASRSTAAPGASPVAAAAAAAMTAGAASMMSAAPNASSFVTVAVVPAGGDTIGLSEFTSRLVAALERIGDGPVLHLTAARLDAALGEGTSTRLNQLFIRAKVGAWLSAQEERHRFIVFEADSASTPETTGAAGQAVPGAGGWDVLQRAAYASPRVAQRVMSTLRGATAGVGNTVHNIGAQVDRAVRAGIGVSPSALLSKAVAAVGGVDASEADRQILSALDAASSRSAGEHASGYGAALARRRRQRPTASAWTRLCVQQADLCLLVGHGQGIPDLSQAERECVFKVTENSAQAGAASPPPAQPAGAASRTEPAMPSRPLDALHANGAMPIDVPQAPPSFWQRLLPWGGAAPNGMAAPHGGDAPGRDRQSGAPSLAVASRGFCRKELVLLHPDPSRRPHGTRRWLRLRRVAWHHHIRTWHEEDYNRIARHICGKARALVLGGGGSRGLAHLGMLQVLEQRHIGVDVIGGTSQGAFMAAAYALTLDTRACVPLVRRLADTIGSTWSLLTSFTLPMISYFSGQAFNEALQDCFRDTQIEDLWLRYFCVSTDITNDTLAVHTTGPLWRYCRASMTVMGLLPPLWDRGRILIDGGYINNLPVEVLRAFAPQVSQTIAVDVENKDNSPFEGIDNYGDSLSGWYIALKWLMSLVRLSKPLKIPPLSEVTLKVSYISHSMMIRELLAHSDDSIIYIRPDVGTRFKLLDYHLMPTIVQAGVDATNAALDRWERRQRRRMLRALKAAARVQLKDMYDRGHGLGAGAATHRVAVTGALGVHPPPPLAIGAPAQAVRQDRLDAAPAQHEAPKLPVGMTPMLTAIAENSVAAAPDPTFGLGERGFDPTSADMLPTLASGGRRFSPMAGIRTVARGSVYGGNLMTSSSLHNMRLALPVPLPSQSALSAAAPLIGRGAAAVPARSSAAGSARKSTPASAAAAHRTESATFTIGGGEEAL